MSLIITLEERLWFLSHNEIEIAMSEMHYRKRKKCRAGTWFCTPVLSGFWNLVVVLKKINANLWSIMESLSRLHDWEVRHTSAERNVSFLLEVQDLWGLWEHYEVQKKINMHGWIVHKNIFNIHLQNIMTLNSALTLDVNARFKVC